MKKPEQQFQPGSDPLWYKDAIIYELHVKSFYDSDGDGVGDFKGLTAKLEYLQNLGVTAVWLLPFYPSPLKDDGYDISDYRKINPDYGTFRDFREFLRQAHKRGIKVITELVLNHTSERHPWFQRAKKSKPSSSWRNFYVWSKTADKYRDARVIFQDFESSNWTWDPEAGAYYWHRFYSHQPDLNFDHPPVQKAMMSVINSWLRIGVDGLRLDAVPYLFEREGTNCENLPETHQFLKRLRSHVDKNFLGRMFLAEANQWAEDAAAYFGEGNEAQMAFNFPLMPRIFMAAQMEDRFPIIDILDPPIHIPESCQWAMFLRNHDELTLEMVTDEERDYMYRVYADDPRAKINLGIRRRLAPLLRNNRRKIELMNILLFSLPGTPIIYYGDEIGMGDNFYLGDRDGVRTPMQWSSDRNAGFSRTNPQKLYLPVIIDPEYHYETINVENQESNLSSLLWWMRRVIAMRKRYKAFGRGSIEFLLPKNTKILAFIRRYQEEILLVVVNLSRFSQVAELDLSAYRGFNIKEVFSRNSFPPVRNTPYVLTLGPHNHFWFSLFKETEPVSLDGDFIASPISLKKSLEELFTGRMKERFKQEILTPYLKKCRWFGGKGRRINSLSVVDKGLFRRGKSRGVFLVVGIRYDEGNPERYFLPLAYAQEQDAHRLVQKSPEAVVKELRIGSEQGILYDAAFSAAFHELFLEMVTRKKKLQGDKGEWTGSAGLKGLKILCGPSVSQDTSVLRAEQSNTSILYGKKYIMKIFRRLDEGVNPDVAIHRKLTEKAGFPHIARFLGALEYRQSGEEPASIGILQSFVLNQGDAWIFTVDKVGNFLETILAKKDHYDELPQLSPLLPLEEAKQETEEKAFEMLGGFFVEMISVLGKRTGQLHQALASLTEEEDFRPEPFSVLYQRSVFQSMRSLVRSVFRLLEENMAILAPEIRTEARDVLNSRQRIVERMNRMTEKKIEAVKIRTHGDFHLGQVLFTGKDFVIIDFEGEPARPLSERRLKRSALRDVAGMIRSFHYAAYTGLLRHPSLRSEDRVFLEPWLKVWHHHVSRIFLRAYTETAGEASFLPQNKSDLPVLLDAFLLEKAVYEIGYELNNRPDWLIIPIRGISFILKGGSGKSQN